MADPERYLATCHSGAHAKQSRINGILANVEATTLAHSFEVEKDEMPPTHSFLRIKVSSNAMVEKRTYVKTPTSLESFVTKKWTTKWNRKK